MGASPHPALTAPKPLPIVSAELRDWLEGSEGGGKRALGEGAEEPSKGHRALSIMQRFPNLPAMFCG